MALLDSEIVRLKYELGLNVVGLGAEPYIGISQLFEQVIQPYVTGGASTTSATPVTEATTPTPVALTLASATDFSAGDRVIVDVDGRQESATIAAISGAAITVQLSKTHSGTYPVTVEGGESILRAILRKLQDIDGLSSADAGAISAALESAGLRKVDEVEFFGGGKSGMSPGESRIDSILALREYWRDELASALGIDRPNRAATRRGGSGISVY